MDAPRGVPGVNIVEPRIDHYGDHRVFNIYNRPTRSQDDPTKSFSTRVTETLSEGGWHALEGIPGIITSIFVQTAATIVAQKTMAWFNGDSEEGPSSEDKALLKSVEKQQMKLMLVQMTLKQNKQALEDLKDELVEFGYDAEETEKINAARAELLEQRKILNARYHELASDIRLVNSVA